MKLLSVITTFIISIYATVATNISHEELYILQDICQSFDHLSKDEQVEALVTLNIPVNWHTLIRIQECKDMFWEHFDVIFQDSSNFMLFVQEGESLWRTLENYVVITEIFSLIKDKLGLLPIDTLMPFLIHLYPF